MITSWEIVTNDIDDDAPPTGETVIEAVIDKRRGEDIGVMIERGVRECYEYRDREGYHCDRLTGHPRNNHRLNMGLRPLYLAAFSVKDDPTTPWRFSVILRWKTPDDIPGGMNEHVPPRRGQWSENRQSLYDPNTKILHQTTAGELIRGLNEDYEFPTLSYTWKGAQIPRWFKDAQAGCINSDYIRLDGESFEPYQLRCMSATCDSFWDDKSKSWWRDINLELAVNRDTWDKIVPNIGYYENRLYGLLVEKQGVDSNDPNTAQPFYKLGTSPIDVYPYISSQKDLDKFFKASREGRSLWRRTNGVFGDLFKVFISYEPIMTIINPRGDQESKEVDKPVPLDANGAAIRDWDVNSSNGTVTGGPGSVSTGKRPIPLKTELKEDELIILKRRTRKAVRMSEWGLW